MASAEDLPQCLLSTHSVEAERIRTHTPFSFPFLFFSSHVSSSAFLLFPPPSLVETQTRGHMTDRLFSPPAPPAPNYDTRLVCFYRGKSSIFFPSPTRTNGGA